MSARLLNIPILLLVAFSASAGAQSLPTGKWTGTVYPPNGASVAVTFDVQGEGNELAITMGDTPFGDIELVDIVLGETTLDFVWVPNSLVLKCKLERQDDGSYRGPCTDEDGVPGTIVMVPPESMGS